jgi:hypothetical protein
MDGRIVATREEEKGREKYGLLYIIDIVSVLYIYRRSDTYRTTMLLFF